MYTVTVCIYGVVAQLVECLVRIQEVVGSNPISSTKTKILSTIVGRIFVLYYSFFIIQYSLFIRQDFG